MTKTLCEDELWVEVEDAKENLSSFLIKLVNQTCIVPSMLVVTKMPCHTLSHGLKSNVKKHDYESQLIMQGVEGTTV
uniref:Uncharacterized protein n=1 Tax=Romanomermis culicivorax TaxID=13658 RepID=A0A915JV46_ROMCU